MAESQPKPPRSARHATKRLSNRWSLNTSYLWSRLYGNDGGLASSDENGRTAPNVAGMQSRKFHGAL